MENYYNFIDFSYLLLIKTFSYSHFSLNFYIHVFPIQNLILFNIVHQIYYTNNSNDLQDLDFSMELKKQDQDIKENLKQIVISIQS